MPSTTLIPMEFAPSVVIIDDELPPLADTMQSLVAYRSSEMAVPADLVHSIRAYRLRTLAEAVERYNDRLARRRVAATA